MPLKLDGKKALVAEMSQAILSAVSVVGAHNMGITSTQMAELRSCARAQGVSVKVVRNTLARRAMEGSEFACLQSDMVGPMLLAYSHDDPGAPARLFKAFAAQNSALVLRTFAVGGRAYRASEINRLANLPTRDEALSRLLAVWQAPLAKWVRTLAAPHTKLARAMAAVRDKKQAEAGASA